MSTAPLDEAVRLELLSRMHEAVQAQADVVWECAVAFHDTGTSVELLAPAIGMSVRSFYRRLGSTRPG